MSPETLLPEMAAQVNWKTDEHPVLDAMLRQKALNLLENTPFPTTKTEAWKYTRTTKLKNGAFAANRSSLTDTTHTLSDTTLKMVFVNGYFTPELSANSFPHGLKLQALSQMDKEEIAVLGQQLPLENELFNAFNTAFATDGVYLHVSAKMQIEPVIEIIHISTGKASLVNVRHFITAEAFSNIHIVQQFVSSDASGCFTNCVSEITVAKNANVSIDKLQYEDESCFQYTSEQVHQETDSQFTINTFTLNGGWVRNNLNIDVNGQNCETNLNGAYILKGQQHVDNHTIVDHKVAHCQSNELYKGVLDGKSTAVFNGKVFVRKDAQKINAFQSNGNVLLSDDATVNSKPELEIYADDVKCSHGSTTGQLDEQAIFYLRARGIGEKAARQLMVSAFIGDVLEKADYEPVQERITHLLRERFGWN